MCNSSLLGTRNSLSPNDGIVRSIKNPLIFVPARLEDSFKVTCDGLWENGKSSFSSVSPGTYASKTGVAQEAVQNVRRSSKLTEAEAEARLILGVTEQSSWEETLQRYNLFEQNAKNGSFYLQSKVHRANECLAIVNQTKAEGTTN